MRASSPAAPGTLLSHDDFCAAVEEMLGDGDVLLAHVFVRDLPRIKAQFGVGVGDEITHRVQDLLLGLGHGVMVTMASPSLYAIAFPHGGDPVRLQAVLRDRQEWLNRQHAHPFLISFAAGIALAKPGALSAIEWINRANLALGMSGRSNRTVVFDEKAEVLDRIRDAFARQSQLTMPPAGMHWIYEPVADARTLVADGVEALCRWTIPGVGEVSPAMFVTVVEEMEMSHHLDRWTLHAVESAADRLRDMGMLHIGVNLAPSTLSLDPSYVQAVLDLVGFLGERGMVLVIELTESLIGRQTELIVDQLRIMRDAGAQIAIDDFGSGATNLLAISGLPCDYLKLDGAFLRQGCPALREGLLEIGCRMAALLGAQVVAEGVETADDLELVVRMGIPMVQGWHVGNAINLDD